MPHITIEYSQNLARHHDIDGLVAAIHGAAIDDGLPPVAGLRTRAVGREHYRVATADSEFAFVAIVARIGPGREAEAKTRFVTRLIDTAEETLASGPLKIAFSAEVQEIDPEFRINRNHIRPYMERKAAEENNHG